MVTPEVADFIVGAYVQKRRDADNESKKGNPTYVSARTLLGIIRLSQALARLRFSSEVNESDIREALRLVDVSRSSLETHEHNDGL
jgi:DNA replication licensing factor MCM7